MESEREEALRRAMGYMESMVAEGKVLPEPGADPNFDRVYGKARPTKKQPAQPAWPIADQPPPPLWTGADELPGMWEEADLIGGWTDQPPPAVSPAEAALPSGSVAGEVSALLAALGDRPAFLTPAEAAMELSQLRREVKELRGRGQGVATAGPARTHEWEFRHGSAIVTVETGGTIDHPDGRIRGAYGSVFGVLGAEILCLAGRAQAAEAALAEAEAGWRGEADRARIAEDNLATVEAERNGAEVDRDAARAGLEESLEINAELTAALAALLGEPPPEPCSPGCRTPHLSAKASEAVDEALGRWQAMEMQLKDIQAEHAELLADIGELKAQEASGGNYVIRSMRELRRALQARGLWRPAGRGEPGGGTAGSAIEAIDRLRVRNAILDDLADDACEIIAHLRAGYEGDAKRWGSETIQARIRAVVDDASGPEAERLLEAEKEKVTAPLRAEIDRLRVELAEALASARHNAEGWEESFGRMGALAQRVIDARNEGRIEGLHQAQACIQDLVRESLKGQSDQDS